MPSKSAKYLTSKHHTNDPYEIARFLDFKVIFVPLLDIRGFCQKYKRNTVIYISDHLAEQERRFVCAHEIGHAVLHRGINRFFMDSRTLMLPGRYEREADEFAANLLWSDDELRAYQEWTIPQIAVRLGISEKLAEYRMLSVIPRLTGI